LSDLAELSSRFADRLRAVGVPVTTTGIGRFASSIAISNPRRVDELYWLGRVTLVSDHTHINTYTRVFDDIFRGIADLTETRNPNVIDSLTPQAPSTPPTRTGAPRTTDQNIDQPMSGGAGVGDAGENDSDGMLAAASDLERLNSKPFGVCTPDELERLRQVVLEFRLDPPMRSSRRTRVRSTGERLDVRTSMRRAHRTGGDPVRLARRQRRQRPRRVVLVADVSGSMESYGRAYLYLLHGAVRAINAEAFVFATRLHRLTRPLAMKSPSLALSRAMEEAPDWSGGTRIGSALAEFNNQYARRGVGRGAVIVIVSDGWERGDPSLLAQEMQRLSRLAFHIVWVNPRKQSAQYQPLVGGMAAALPYIDTFLSGHSVDRLEEVIAAIAQARRSAPRTTEMVVAGRTGPHQEGQFHTEFDPEMPGLMGRSPSGSTPIPPFTTRSLPDLGPAIPATSMQPDYGSLTKLSEHRRWDFTTGP
jgi:uncharacterized protein